MSVPTSPRPEGSFQPPVQPGVPASDGGPASQDRESGTTGTHDGWAPGSQDGWAAGAPDLAPAPPSWGPPPVWAPSWEHPQAAFPPPPLPGPGFAAGPARSAANSPWILVLVALVSLLAGAAGAGLVTTALFASGAEDLGRGMAEDLAPRISADVGDEMAASMEDVLNTAMGGFTDEEMTAEPVGPVEQFPPTEPGNLGPDPVLDDYADSCFDGDLQACDDLFYGAPPLSDYEEYAATCGGRVKLYEVMYCVDLE